MMNVSSFVPAGEPWQNGVRLVLVISLNVVNYTLGLSLQSSIIRLVSNRRRRLEPCDVLILNQAAAEIFFMLLGPFHILLSVRNERWFYQPMGLILGTGMAVRSGLQCCTCLERYVAVVHPITFRKFRPLRYRVGLCMMVWVAGTLTGVICMMKFPDIPYQAFGVIYSIIMSINVFSCVSILKRLRLPGPGEGNAARLVEDSVKKRAFQVVLVNMLLFLVQNTPLAVLFAMVHTLPSPVFKLSTYFCLIVNLGGGWVQALFIIQKFQNQN
ncbi:Ovarian cancer G-protein coupled receptor 1 [Bagarius yarrelli]|uniref:Ovarian cancer G-protein coupled receptor 1 n=1 Tax=Bagarius yarrelli TaxID=175774 RepID=A0A556VW39_BAGYA|nr:Ovarian cancer G-protein coupled receptor 1 [Bagarius yarrelli]